MNRRIIWAGLVAITAGVWSSAASAQEVVLQDGGVVVAANPIPADPGATDSTGPPSDTANSPEPATLTLLGLGGLGALWSARRRKTAAQSQMQTK